MSEMETFINESSKYSTKEYGNPMPARVLWSTLDDYPELTSTTGYGMTDYGSDGKKIEIDRSIGNGISKIADWDLINASMLDVLKHFPSDWNAQKFLYIACQRGDKKQAQLILPYIKEETSLELFHAHLPVFEKCKKWAAGKLSFLLYAADGSMRVLQ